MSLITLTIKQITASQKDQSNTGGFPEKIDSLSTRENALLLYSKAWPDSMDGEFSTSIIAKNLDRNVPNITVTLAKWEKSGLVFGKVFIDDESKKRTKKWALTEKAKSIIKEAKKKYEKTK